MARREVQVLESFGPATEEAKTAIHATCEWKYWAQLPATHARIAAVMAATSSLDLEAGMQAQSPSCRPDYPDAALRARAMGQTRVRVVVTADGTVTDSEIIQESGLTREHHLLDVAVQLSLAKCPVKPALAKDGTPTTSAIEMTYNWKLE